MQIYDYLYLVSIKIIVKKLLNKFPGCRIYCIISNLLAYFGLDFLVLSYVF